MIIGLTGGVGCGKTTTARMFVELPGWSLIDADAICAELYDRGAPDIVDPLRRRWGDLGVIDENGSVLRGRIADIVFENRGELSWLQSIVHPVVKREVEERSRTSSDDVVVEVPLLFEASWEAMFDSTAAVWAPAEIRRERLAARGWSATEAARRERAQLTSEEKLEKANVGLINADSLTFLRRQCRRLATMLTNRRNNCGNTRFNRKQ